MFLIFVRFTCAMFPPNVSQMKVIILLPQVFRKFWELFFFSVTNLIQMAPRLLLFPLFTFILYLFFSYFIVGQSDRLIPWQVAVNTVLTISFSETLS